MCGRDRRVEERSESGDVAAPVLFILAVIVGIGVHHELTKPPAEEALAGDPFAAHAFEIDGAEVDARRWGDRD
ncbi:MAG: hypothetical protein AAGM38_04385 [Pseudomonadota bacterium]